MTEDNRQLALTGVGSTRSPAPTSSAHASRFRSSDADAAECKAVLLGCYREHGNVDPEIFNAALSQLFRAYPRAVGEAVVDPVTGLPARLKWLPSIAEIREALDAEQVRHDRRNAPRVVRQIEPPEDPEMRKRVGEGMRKLATDLRMQNAARPDRDPEAEAKATALRERAEELGADEAAWKRAMREFEHG